MSKNAEDLGILNVAKGFKKFPKVQLIAQSGHTGHNTGKEASFTWADLNA